MHTCTHSRTHARTHTHTHTHTPYVPVLLTIQCFQDGRLHHDHIAEVWKDYPNNLHSWMLRLTEEFDLTFPLTSEKTNLVPCLLPEKEPEVCIELNVVVFYKALKCHIKKTKTLPCWHFVSHFISLIICQSIFICSSMTYLSSHVSVFIHPYIHLSINPSFHSSICSSMYIHSFIQSIHSFIHVIHSSIHLFIHPSTHPSVCISIHLFISVHSWSIHRTEISFIQPSFYPCGPSMYWIQ